MRPGSRTAVAAAAALLAAAASAPAEDEDPFADRWTEFGAARLQALDKVTGRVSEIAAEAGAAARFGTLEIRAAACWRRPPELPPDAAAFLEIVERRSAEAPARPWFRGWMFASSPGLSALEHPVYDVIVLDCAGPPAADGTNGSQSAADSGAGSE